MSSGDRAVVADAVTPEEGGPVAWVPVGAAHTTRGGRPAGELFGAGIVGFDDAPPWAGTVFGAPDPTVVDVATPGEVVPVRAGLPSPAPVGGDPVTGVEPLFPAPVATGAPVPGVGVEADPLDSGDPAPEESVVVVPPEPVPAVPVPEATSPGEVPAAPPVETPVPAAPVPDVEVPELPAPVDGSVVALFVPVPVGLTVVDVPVPVEVAVPPDGSLLTVGEVVAVVPAVGSVEGATVELVAVVVSADAQPGATSMPGAASVTATGKSLRADRTGRDGFGRMRADALFDIDQFLAR